MYKIVFIPGKLKNVFSKFCDLFTKQIYENFSYIMATIIACRSKRKTLLQLYGTIAEVCKDKKTYQAYRYFFNKSKWDEDEVAQRSADLFFKAVGAETGKRILIIVDDTFEDKKGKKTFGVGKFWDHKDKKYIWGNNIVTSAIQYKDVFIPYKAKLFVKEDDAEKWNVKFRKKHEIAYEDIIKPLRVPRHAKVYVVVDAGYFNNEFIINCRKKHYHVIGRVKQNYIIEKDNLEINIKEYFEEKFKKGEWKEETIKVRGKEKTYYIIEDVVNLKSIGKCKVVASKKDLCDEAKYYGSTDLRLCGREILFIYESRCDIETVHKESNQKLGFKDYQMLSKQGIERTIQLMFIVWAILLLLTLGKKGVLKSALTLREMLEPIRTRLDLSVLYFMLDHFGIRPPLGEINKLLKKIGCKI